MTTPKITLASEVLLDFFGLYLYARLLADSAVSYLAELFDAAQKSLRDVNDKERAAYRDSRIAQAKLDFADFQLDRVVRGFEAALLAFVNKKRDHFEYKRFFPKGLGAVVNVAPALELERVRAIETDLAHGTTFDEGAKWLSAIHEQRLIAETAFLERQAAETAYDEAFRAEMKARNEWQAVYRSIFGKLTDLFPQDRARVESYFARPKEAKDKDPIEVTLVEPAPAGEPAAPASPDTKSS